MGLFILSVVVLVAIALVYWYRLKPAARPSAENRLRSNPYLAVSVSCPKDACAAARKLEAKRFLAKEAPPLPLPNCTAKKCGCRFTHYADRRDEQRRENSRIGHYDGAQRRVLKDRRAVHY